MVTYHLFLWIENVSSTYLSAQGSSSPTRLHQSISQARCKSRIFIEFSALLSQAFPKFAKYFGRPLCLLKPMYGMAMTLSGKYWYQELQEYLIEQFSSNAPPYLVYSRKSMKIIASSFYKTRPAIPIYFDSTSAIAMGSSFKDT